MNEEALYTMANDAENTRQGGGIRRGQRPSEDIYQYELANGENCPLAVREEDAQC